VTKKWLTVSCDILVFIFPFRFSFYFFFFYVEREVSTLLRATFSFKVRLLELLHIMFQDVVESLQHLHMQK